ncbi:hypothetical protein ACQKD0_02145 [Vreelandella aquamarina]|nr:hypothetical protein [Halomonas meridiana]
MSTIAHAVKVQRWYNLAQLFEMNRWHRDDHRFHPSSSLPQ